MIFSVGSRDVDKKIKQKEKYNMAWISYDDEYVNLDNVIAAKKIDDNCIKLHVIGSAGAGRKESYDIQHREINLHWPVKVFEELMSKKAGCLFHDGD